MSTDTPSTTDAEIDTESNANPNNTTDLESVDIIAAIETQYGSVDEFLQSDDAQDELSETHVHPVRDRPDTLPSVNQRIDTGYGKLYVNITEDEQGRPFEVFANIGNSGGITNSYTEALAKVISDALRAGVDPEELADDLQGIRSPKIAWDQGESIQSIPDAIGVALHRYLEGDL